MAESTPIAGDFFFFFFFFPKKWDRGGPGPLGAFVGCVSRLKLKGAKEARSGRGFSYFPCDRADGLGGGRVFRNWRSRRDGGECVLVFSGMGDCRLLQESASAVVRTNRIAGEMKTRRRSPNE